MKRGSPLRPFVFLSFSDRLDEGVGREARAPYKQPKVHCTREGCVSWSSVGLRRRMGAIIARDIPSPSSVTSIRPYVEGLTIRDCRLHKVGNAYARHLDASIAMCALACKSPVFIECLHPTFRDPSDARCRLPLQDRRGHNARSRIHGVRHRKAPTEERDTHLLYALNMVLSQNSYTFPLEFRHSVPISSVSTRPRNFCHT